MSKHYEFLYRVDSLELGVAAASPLAWAEPAALCNWLKWHAEELQQCRRLSN